MSSGSGSGSSSDRFQDVEPATRRRRVDSVASVADSQMSSTGPTVLSHRNSLEENGISPRGGFGFLDSMSPADAHRTSQRQASSLGRGLPQDASQQQLPSLSDMLEDGNRPSQMLPRNPGIVESPSPMHQDNMSKNSSVSGASSNSRPTGDSANNALPIHALLSNQEAGKLYEKAPLPRGRPSMPTDAAGTAANRTPGYGMCRQFTSYCARH
jgi:hypothetical protein